MPTPNNEIIKTAVDSFPDGELWSVERAASETGRSIPTIYRWIRTGRIKAYRSATGPMYILADEMVRFVTVREVGAK